MDWKDKLSSRKFWISIAAALASLGTGITGLVQGNEKLALAGGILLVVSSSIYAFCEAWVDGKAVDTAKQAKIANMLFDMLVNDPADTKTDVSEDDCK